MVETQGHSLFLAGISQLLHHIPFKRRIHDVVIGKFGIPHAEAIVMLGGEANVLRSRFDKQVGPLVRIERSGVKIIDQIPIVALKPIEIFVSLGPTLDLISTRPIVLRNERPALAAVPEGIEAPVEDHAKTKALKPFETFLKPLRLRLSCGRRMGKDVLAHRPLF